MKNATWKKNKKNCGVPGSPCLSKTGPVWSVFFLILSGLSICIHLDQLLHLNQVSSLPGAKVVRWRPISLARDNYDKM